MADRRMICASVVQSDEFLEMDFEAQALYFQLIIAADNFGFVPGVKRVLRGAGATEKALETLKGKRFVIPFDSGVIVVSHWFVANWGGDFAKNDRTVRTTFLDELSQLDVDSMGGYVLKANDAPMRQVGSPDSVQFKVREYINRLLPQSETTDGFREYLYSMPWVNVDAAMGYREKLPDDVIQYALETAHNNWGVAKMFLDRFVKNDIKTIEQAKTYRAS